MTEVRVIHSGSASGSYADPEGPDASLEMLRFLLGDRRRSRLLRLYYYAPYALQ